MKNTQQQTSDTEVQLEPVDVKAQHSKLYRKVQIAGEALQGDASIRDHLMPAINQLIANMGGISLQMMENNNFTDYDWLERTATEWQKVFSQILVEPRNIREEIKLPPRPLIVPSSPERAPISYEKIKSMNIEVIAYRIGENRKLAGLRRQVQELDLKAKDLMRRIEYLEQNRSRIHSEILGSKEDEAQDWYAATVYFAAGVLAGRPNLAYQLGADSYTQLEKVYLDEVKRLNAYCNWKSRNCGWGVFEMTKDYLGACGNLHEKLLNSKMKASIPEFNYIRKYLKKKYHVDNKAFLSSDDVKKLICEKAYRIWESKLRPPQSHKQREEDWLLAEKYVDLFYTNVIPAVEGHHESMKEVLKAFCGPYRDHNAINCFETAIAIYFLDPALIRECCDDVNTII